MHVQKAILVHCLGGVRRGRAAGCGERSGSETPSRARSSLSGGCAAIAWLVLGCAQGRGPERGAGGSNDAARRSRCLPTRARVGVRAGHALDPLQQDDGPSQCAGLDLHVPAAGHPRDELVRATGRHLLGDRPRLGRTYAVLIGAEATDRRAKCAGSLDRGFLDRRRRWMTGGRREDPRRAAEAGGCLLVLRLRGIGLAAGGGEPRSPFGSARRTRTGSSGSTTFHGVPLRVCALYDAARRPRLRAEDDVWACLEETVAIATRRALVEGLEIYLVLRRRAGGREGQRGRLHLRRARGSTCCGSGSGGRQSRRAGGLTRWSAAAAADSILGFRRPPSAPIDTRRDPCPPCGDRYPADRRPSRFGALRYSRDRPSLRTRHEPGRRGPWKRDRSSSGRSLPASTGSGVPGRRTGTVSRMQGKRLGSSLIPVEIPARDGPSMIWTIRMRRAPLNRPVIGTGSRLRRLCFSRTLRRRASPVKTAKEAA